MGTCWLGKWAKGICRLQELTWNPVGGLGCLEACVEAGRSFWWGAGGQAQVAENLDDDRGIFNACPASRRVSQDGQRASAL